MLVLLPKQLNLRFLTGAGCEGNRGRVIGRVPGLVEDSALFLRAAPPETQRKGTPLLPHREEETWWGVQGGVWAQNGHGVLSEGGVFQDRVTSGEHSG